MSAPAPSRRRGFRCDRGAVAIEFAILAVPTIILIFMMIYSGILHLASGVLDTNLEKVAYRVYEGRPLCVGVGNSDFPYDASCLRDRICEEAPVVLVSEATCKVTALVDVRLMQENGSDVIPPMLSGNAINAAAFGTSSGIRDGRVVVMRVLLPFPNFTFASPSAPTIGFSGERILMSSTAFRIRDLRVYSRPPS